MFYIYTESYKAYTEYKLPFTNFVMMFEWRSTHADKWRHHLMTSCNSDPAKKKLTEIFPFKERTITNFYALFGDYSLSLRLLVFYVTCNDISVIHVYKMA